MPVMCLIHLLHFEARGGGGRGGQSYCEKWHRRRPSTSEGRGEGAQQKEAGRRRRRGIRSTPPSLRGAKEPAKEPSSEGPSQEPGAGAPDATRGRGLPWLGVVGRALARGAGRPLHGAADHVEGLPVLNFVGCESLAILEHLAPVDEPLAAFLHLAQVLIKRTHTHPPNPPPIMFGHGVELHTHARTHAPTHNLIVRRKQAQYGG